MNTAAKHVAMSAKGLKEVGQFDKEKFVFIVGKDKYEVCRFQACFFSGKVRRLVASDVTTNRLFMDLEGEDRSLFKDVVSLMEGCHVTVSDKNRDFLERVFVELDNKELLDVVTQVERQPLSADNVIRRLKSKRGMGKSVDQEIDFLAVHFHEFSNKLNCLCDDDIDLILASESLKLVDEESLLEFVVSHRDRGGNTLHFLRHVHPDFLPEERLDEYMSYAKESGLWDVWDVLCDCMQRFVSSCHGKHQEVSYERYVDDQAWKIAPACRSEAINASAFFAPSEPKQEESDEPLFGTQDYDEMTRFKGNPRGGIIGYLRTQFRGNVHLKGIVNITASSTLTKQPHRVADREWTSYWSSKNEPNSWIMYDFKNKVVCPTHYSLRCTEWGWPKKWKLSGSNDGQTWTILDRRNTNDLSDNICESFACEGNASLFRFIRVTQTGVRNGWADKHFCLSEFEVFGTVRPVQ